METVSSDDSSSSASENSNLMDYDLYPADWSLESLRQAALRMRLSRLRSLAWGILLQALPPLDCNIIERVKVNRQLYEDLRAKFTTDPRAVIGDDPLSQNDQSVWKRHFCDNELKAVIMQDVVRTFPDEPYFRDKEVQDLMVRILFCWARGNPSVGYRQGMHEVLAPLLYELHKDRRHAPKDISDTLKCILDDNFLEHDSYTLFSALMVGLERFYSTPDAPSADGRLPTAKEVHNPNEVVKYLNVIKEDYLVPIDKELAAHLDACNITMELFGIRWLRLLFGREFSRSEIPDLWGFLFAEGPSLPNIHYIVLAMLAPLRNELVGSDAGTALALLMRGSPLSAHHVCRLALHLRSPLTYPMPREPRIRRRKLSTISSPSLEQAGSAVAECDMGSEGVADGVAEGVAEGADVARELAALAVVRARLPRAAAALVRALPRVPRAACAPLHTLLQLAALLECRNRALVDVETALEAAEMQDIERVGQRQTIAVSVAPAPPPNPAPQRRFPPKVKEVPLKLFYQQECNSASDLPFLDPLRLRTE